VRHRGVRQQFASKGGRRVSPSFLVLKRGGVGQKLITDFAEQERRGGINSQQEKEKRRWLRLSGGDRNRAPISEKKKGWPVKIGKGKVGGGKAT